MASIAAYLRLVRFSHSIFALPFALQGAWLAGRGRPEWRTLGWVVVCAVAARTAAMAFNRLVDRDIDARNPRTKMRELPAGVLGARSVALLVALAAGVFVAAAFRLNALCGWLSLPVLLVLFTYSYVKRFSWTAHAFLGVSLALAPLGAWLAVRGAIDASVAPVLVLALAVVAWVAGFDLIYACQDAEFDRGAGLHSLPARFGIGRALLVARCLHVLTIGALIAVGVLAGLSWPWWLAVALAACLLVWEHSLVAPDDLSRVDLAFFTLNGWVAVGLFVGLALDLALARGGA